MIRFYSDKKSLFVYLYFLISILEIGAEYFENSTVIWLTKPLILPILLLYYLQRTSKWALFYTLALGVNWLANIAFILKSEWTTFCALLLFVLHRVFVLLQIAKFERKRGIGLLPVLFGSAPFMILFLSVINLSFEAIVVPDLYILLLQSVLMSIFGGILMGSFLAGVNAQEYLRHVPTIVTPFSIANGLFKCFVFAVILSTICTYRGFTTTGGAKGVGLSVVKTSVATMIGIVIADWVTTFLGDIVVRVWTDHF